LRDACPARAPRVSPEVERPAATFALADAKERETSPVADEARSSCGYEPVKAGFIGLGVMGQRMALNLARAGTP
jgi:NAD binding domain of 6-phosphogluconate dehydrogenase